MSINDTAGGLGARVRELRRERGLTLKALGSEAGLSHPFLSQLERGLARPSVASVERIARALEVPVSALWAAPRRGAPEIARAADGTVSEHANGVPGGVRELPGAGAMVRAWEWSGGSRSWPEEMQTAAGEVLLYVAHGILEIELEGTIHTLGEGDAIRYDGAVPHRVRRRGGPRTRALFVAHG